jgi:hypothetical protein
MFATPWSRFFMMRTSRILSTPVAHRAALFIATLLAVHPSTALAQAATQQRGVSPAPPRDPVAGGGGAYFALVIGINQYRDPLPSLKTAAGDAEAMAKLLSERYGFRVTLLLNGEATRANILNAFNQYRRNLHENDSLLIYYAGHGSSEREADKAYWLPADAEADTSSNWIIADELTTDIRLEPARHVLIISDSCYSGGLTRDADTRVRSNDQQVYLGKMSSRKSRTLMSSGGNEPVADGGGGDHSIFAKAVLNGLDQIEGTAFTGQDLFQDFVKPRVAGGSNQIPIYSQIRNSDDEAGDFVFKRATGGTVERIAFKPGDSKPSAPGPISKTTEGARPTPPDTPAGPNLDDLEQRYILLSARQTTLSGYFETQRGRLRSTGGRLRPEIEQALNESTANLKNARKLLDQKQGASASKSLDALEANCETLKSLK